MTRERVALAISTRARPRHAAKRYVRCVRLLVPAVAIALAITVTTTAAAERPAARTARTAKKCFKRKHGKRVRVKCPVKKEKTPPATPAPAPPPPAPPQQRSSDPMVKALVTSELTGQVLHHFSMSAGGFEGEETLNLCPDGTYKYFAQYYLATGGLLGPGKLNDLGTWSITGALPAADGSSTAGLLTVPRDGSGARFTVVDLFTHVEGNLGARIAGDEWYIGPSSVCG